MAFAVLGDSGACKASLSALATSAHVSRPRAEDARVATTALRALMLRVMERLTIRHVKEQAFDGHASLLPLKALHEHVVP